jgi:hypothetical protein
MELMMPEADRQAASLAVHASADSGVLRILLDRAEGFNAPDLAGPRRPALICVGSVESCSRNWPTVVAAQGSSVEAGEETGGKVRQVPALVGEKSSSWRA